MYFDGHDFENIFLNKYFSLLKEENPDIDIEKIKENFFANRETRKEQERAEQIKKEIAEEFEPHLRNVTITDADNNIIHSYKDLVTVNPIDDKNSEQNL